MPEQFRASVVTNIESCLENIAAAADAAKEEDWEQTAESLRKLSANALDATFSLNQYLIFRALAAEAKSGEGAG